jgi:hypothetical protein
MRDLIGGDWGIGYFKYHACSYCDDVLAETADVAVGDAWLPHYVNDSRGANVVVVRNRELQAITEMAIKRGHLAFDSVSADLAMLSQQAGLRDRRSGLAYRLHKATQAGQWVPTKRVSPNSYRLDPWFRTQQDLRDKLSAKSHVAFDQALVKGSVHAYERELEPELSTYYAHLKRPSELLRRVLKMVVISVRQKLNLSIERSFGR